MSRVQPLDARLLRRMPLPRPEQDTDKNSRGRVLIAGGSAMSAGAVVLSGLAALRAGAGKVLLAVPQPLSLAIAVDFPEAGVKGFTVTAKGNLSPDTAAKELGALLAEANAVLLGPGLSDETSAQKLAHNAVAIGRGCALRHRRDVRHGALGSTAAAVPTCRQAGHHAESGRNGCPDRSIQRGRQRGAHTYCAQVAAVCSASSS